ncbi:MAG: hypothetical protein AAGF23_08010, partial [Acidobacteriota bacterium]
MPFPVAAKAAFYTRISGLFLCLLLAPLAAAPAAAQDPARVVGQVTVDGVPLPNVWIRGLPGGVVTDDFGRFRADVALGWDGTLTPWLPGYTFEPAALALQDVFVTTAADFTADERPPGYAALRMVEAGDPLPSNPSPEDLVWVGPGLYDDQLDPRPGVTYLGAGADAVTVRSAGTPARMGNSDDYIHIEGFTLESTAGSAVQGFSSNRPVRLRHLRMVTEDDGLDLANGNDSEPFDFLAEGLSMDDGRNGVLLSGPDGSGDITLRHLVFRGLTDGIEGSMDDLDLTLEHYDARGIVSNGVDLDVATLTARNALVQAGADGFGLFDATVADISQVTLLGASTALLSGSGTEAALYDSILSGNAEGIDGSGIVALDHIVYEDGWTFSGPSYTFGDGLLRADPRFVDPMAGDYTLLSDSPARGAGRDGQDLGAYGGPLGDRWTPAPLTPRPALRRIILGGAAPHQAPGSLFTLRPYGIVVGGWVGPIDGLTAWTSSDPSVVVSLGGGAFEAVGVGDATVTADA